MEWTQEAEEALKRVPLFVRKKVKTRIEKEAAEVGKSRITLAEVQESKERFRAGMKSEIVGYQADICFGPTGCPNRANPGDQLLDRLQKLFKEADLFSFLKGKVKGDLKYHHEFRLSVAECPNACSQPQIKDIGIIGACRPAVTDADCTLCGACVEACREEAVRLDEAGGTPIIDFFRCLSCGKCIAACPTGTLDTGRKGFRVQLGGKLGRHPRLALELPGTFTEDQVISIVSECIALYKSRCKSGERFGELLREEDLKRWTPGTIF